MTNDKLPLTGHPWSRSDPTDERVDEIGRLVDHFYTASRADPLIGPIFERNVADWDAHLATMRRFWLAVVYRTGGYSGRPLEAHLKLGPLGAKHFDRWLALWERSVAEIVASDAADDLVEYARRMARTMSQRLEILTGSDKDASCAEN